MNVRLLQTIKARILAEPDAFRMDVWSCGTAYCIAGWACTVSGLPLAEDKHGTLTTPDGRRVEDAAADLLAVPRIGEDRARTAFSLFYTSGWPTPFGDEYELVSDREDNDELDTSDARRERARIAAERIDRFIATNGAE